MEKQIEFSTDTVDLSFEQGPDGNYYIQSHDRYGQVTGDYDVAKEDLFRRIPTGLADYIKTECELAPRVYHSVPLQRMFAVVPEYMQLQQERKSQGNSDQVNLNGVSHLSFGLDSPGYRIQTNCWNGRQPVVTGDFVVSEKGLEHCLPASIAEYIKQASQIKKPLGSYDMMNENSEWRYGWHEVPVKKEFGIPEEYVQELDRHLGRNNMIVPTRINNVDISAEQQEALRQGELVVVRGVSKGDEKKTLAVKLDSEKGFQKMEVPFFMENAPLSEIKELWDVNARFNEQLSAFEKRELSGDLVLGKPFDLLKTCGLQESKIFVKQKVLGEHLRKHGLSTGDVKNLAAAIQAPLMVYEWGSKAKSLIAITGIEVSDGRKVTAAVKLERQGQKLEVNELASIHGKEIGQLVVDMSVREKDFGRNKLRYVDKNKTLDWLGIAPPKGASSLTRQEFSEPCSESGIAPPKGASSLTEAQIHVTNIIQNFENPIIFPDYLLPVKINGAILSEEQRVALRKGEAVLIPRKNDPSHTVQVKIGPDGQVAVVPTVKAEKRQAHSLHRRMR